MELCGEAFITKIHAMLDEYDAYEQPPAIDNDKKSVAVSDSVYSENKDL